jgi:hypothetical protein
VYPPYTSQYYGHIKGRGRNPGERRDGDKSRKGIEEWKNGGEINLR